MDWVHVLFEVQVPAAAVLEVLLPVEIPASFLEVLFEVQVPAVRDFELLLSIRVPAWSDLYARTFVNIPLPEAP